MSKVQAPKAKMAGLEGICLLTSCSVTRAVQPLERGIDLPKGLTMSEALTEWMRRLNKHTPSKTPGEIYRGIGFHTLTKIQKYIPAEDIYVVSGGQGMMRLTDPIIPYDFTTDPKHEDSIHKVVTKEPFVRSEWWRQINQAIRQQEHPAAELLSHRRLMLFAANKSFIKFVVDDLATATAEDLGKLRIIMTGKSLGSIPQHLRPYVLIYDRRLASSSMGNRNDLNHRAALHFMSILAEDPSLVEADVPKHQEAILKALDKIAPADSVKAQGGQTHVPYSHTEELLKKHPDLLKQDPDVAYASIKRIHGTVGGIIQFRKAWRKLSGKGVPSAEGSNKHTQNDTAALEALSSIANIVSPSNKGHITWEEEDSAIRLMQTFLGALKQVNPEARFTGSDVCTWAEKYAESTELKLPAYFSSPNKLAPFLRTYAEELGLAEINLPGSSGRSFRIAS